jgi:esterase/lipase
MTDSILKLQLLARSELALFQIRAQRAAKRTAFYAVAMIFGLLGLVMGNLAAYQALCAKIVPAAAALVVSLADAIIAVMIVLAARGAGPSENEEKLVQEMRNLAQNEINKDIDQVKTEIRQISDELHRIRTALSSFTNGVSHAVMSLLGLLTHASKRR